MIIIKTAAMTGNNEKGMKTSPGLTTSWIGTHPPFASMSLGVGASVCSLFYVIASVQCFPYYWTYILAPNITSSNTVPEFSSTVTTKAHRPTGTETTATPISLVGQAADTVQREELGRLICHSVDIIFLVALVPFLKMFSRFHSLKKEFWWHHSVLVITAAVVSLWLYTFLRETDLMPAYYGKDSDAAESASLAKACLEHASPLQVYMRGTLERTLFPLTLEFMLTAMEILIEAWYFKVIPTRSSARQSTVDSHESVPATSADGHGQTPAPGQPSIDQVALTNRQQPPDNTSAQTRSRLMSCVDLFTKVWAKFISIFQLNAAFLFILVEGVVVRFYLVYDEHAIPSSKLFPPWNFLTCTSDSQPFW